MSAYAIKPWMVSLTLLQSVSVTALDDIPVAYWVVAEAYDLPADILYAVAMAESGYRYKDEFRPWPWALNIDGQSFYYDSQQQAHSQMLEAIRRQQSVDTGLMQINWHWHKDRFSTSGDALVPILNLKAGAAVLREQYEVTGDWWEAVGRYHDPGRDQASLNSAMRYRERVKQHWSEVFE